MRNLLVVPRQTKIEMLAKRRSLKCNGQEIERTPLLVPSFSSKGFPDVNKIVEFSSELITDVALVSAYDLHYGMVTAPISFPELVFLDSGGYEASKDSELSETNEGTHIPRPDWTRDLHEAQLAKWDFSIPTVLISFDSPDEKLPLDDQIQRALQMAPGKANFVREILLKPEKATHIRLQMDNIIQRVHRLAEFDIIGVTEKEVGKSIVDRMQNIARLRNALTTSGLDTPIHVFGSLDTITTPLYFLAGADIFDGLTWLRYGYHRGNTIYRQNFGALELGTSVNADLVNLRCWSSNYHYMKELEREMRRFLKDGDFSVFQYNADLFRKSLETVLEALGG
jgi:hypothetical protein